MASTFLHSRPFRPDHIPSMEFVINFFLIYFAFQMTLFLFHSYWLAKSQQERAEIRKSERE